MLLELVISQDSAQISFKENRGKLLLFFIYITAIFAGVLFISVSLFANNGPKEFLYFGVFFTLFGILAVLKYPKQIRKMGTPTLFHANSRRVKFNHRPYEPGKAKELLWPQISKIVLTKKLVLKYWFVLSYEYGGRLILFFDHESYHHLEAYKRFSYKVRTSPNGRKYIVLKYPKNVTKELLVALDNISNKSCSISSYKKIVFNYRKKNEEYVS